MAHYQNEEKNWTQLNVMVSNVIPLDNVCVCVCVNLNSKKETFYVAVFNCKILLRKTNSLKQNTSLPCILRQHKEIPS